LHHPALLAGEEALLQVVEAIERVRRHAERIFQSLATRYSENEGRPPI
jgi:hypothetical protein